MKQHLTKILASSLILGALALPSYATEAIQEGTTQETTSTTTTTTTTTTTQTTPTTPNLTPDPPFGTVLFFNNSITSSSGGTAALSENVAKPGELTYIYPAPDEGYYLKSIELKSSNGAVEVLTDNNSHWFVQPSGMVSVHVTFEKGEGSFAGGTGTSGYNDVKPTDWHHKYIMPVMSNGWMNLVSDNSFEPNTKANRGTIAASLYAMAGSPAVSGGNTFTDVSTDSWYSDGITWCVQNQVVAGISDTVFNPEAPVTREQLTVMLRGFAKYLGNDVESEFSSSSFADDSAISQWARTHVYWAKEAGLIGGKEGNKFDPQGNTTRAELAVVLLALDKI